VSVGRGYGVGVDHPPLYLIVSGVGVMVYEWDHPPLHLIVSGEGYGVWVGENIGVRIQWGMRVKGVRVSVYHMNTYHRVRQLL